MPIDLEMSTLVCGSTKRFNSVKKVKIDIFQSHIIAQNNAQKVKKMKAAFCKKKQKFQFFATQKKVKHVPTDHWAYLVCKTDTRKKFKKFFAAKKETQSLETQG